MRIYFYLLSGAISALLGWTFSTLILNIFNLFQELNSIVVIECMTVFIVLGAIINESLIPNVQRPKLILDTVRYLLIVSLISSILISSVVGIILQFLIPNNISENIIFFLLSIGLSIGIAKGLVDRWFYIILGIIRKANIPKNIVAGSFSGLLVAIIFQLFGGISENLDDLNSLLSFTMLGIFYSLILSFNNFPYYQPVLRAGAGFEYKRERYYVDTSTQVIETYPSIRTPFLRFIHDSEEDEIEEGSSIRLPVPGRIIIGSDLNERADISIPGIPVYVVQLRVKNCQALLIPDPKTLHLIEINGECLYSKNKRILDHNFELTFYTSDKKKCFKFVFYNRFLDPQA